MRESLKLSLKQGGRYLRSLDGRMVLSYCLGVYLFFIFGYFCYLQWVTPALEEQIFAQQAIFNDISAKTQQVNNDPAYKKFKNAKLISKQEAKLSWTKTIPSLISTLQKLQQIGESSNLIITDFQINVDKISVRGSINDLKKIYEANGVLDTFMELGFVKSLDVPFYKQYGGKYEFLLEAMLSDGKEVAKK